MYYPPTNWLIDIINCSQTIWLHVSPCIYSLLTSWLIDVLPGVLTWLGTWLPNIEALQHNLRDALNKSSLASMIKGNNRRVYRCVCLTTPLLCVADEKFEWLILRVTIEFRILRQPLKNFQDSTYDVGLRKIACLAQGTRELSLARRKVKNQFYLDSLLCLGTTAVRFLLYLEDRCHGKRIRVAL